MTEPLVPFMFTEQARDMRHNPFAIVERPDEPSEANERSAAPQSECDI